MNTQGASARRSSQSHMNVTWSWHVAPVPCARKISDDMFLLKPTSGSGSKEYAHATAVL